MGNLITGMNTGIRAPGTDKFNIVVRYFRNSTGQLTLYRAHAGLLVLPAVEAPAVILKGERDAPCPDRAIGGQWLRSKKQWVVRILVPITKQNAGVWTGFGPVAGVLRFCP